MSEPYKIAAQKGLAKWLFETFAKLAFFSLWVVALKYMVPVDDVKLIDATLNQVSTAISLPVLLAVITWQIMQRAAR